MMRHRFGHGELHLVLLALLARQPMHGYELMNDLAQRMGSLYKPSPGSIYPAVASLEAEGLIDATENAGRRTYALTTLGETALNTRLDALARIEDDLGVRFSETSADASLARFVGKARVIAASIAPADLEAELDRTITHLERLAKEER